MLLASHQKGTIGVLDCSRGVVDVSCSVKLMGTLASRTIITTSRAMCWGHIWLHISALMAETLRGGSGPPLEVDIGRHVLENGVQWELSLCVRESVSGLTKLIRTQTTTLLRYRAWRALVTKHVIKPKSNQKQSKE